MLVGHVDVLERPHFRMTSPMSLEEASSPVLALLSRLRGTSSFHPSIFNLEYEQSMALL